MKTVALVLMKCSLAPQDTAKQQAIDRNTQHPGTSVQYTPKAEPNESIIQMGAQQMGAQRMESQRKLIS